MNIITLKDRAEELTNFVEKEKKNLVIPYNKSNGISNQDKFVLEIIKASYKIIFPEEIDDISKIIIKEYQENYINLNLEKFENSEKFKDILENRKYNPIINPNEKIKDYLISKHKLIGKFNSIHIASSYFKINKEENYFLDLYQLVKFKTFHYKQTNRIMFYLDAKIYKNGNCENVFDKKISNELNKEKHLLAYHKKIKESEAKIEVPEFQNLGLKIDFI